MAAVDLGGRPIGLVASLAAALPTCKNLISLEVTAIGRFQLVDIVALVSSPLEVLDSRVIGPMLDLLRILELPALAKLRRWRMFRLGVLVDFSKDPGLAHVSRGLEVRGDERFFTGESAFAVSHWSNRY